MSYILLLYVDCGRDNPYGTQARPDSASEIIDSVRGSPYDGWIQHKVSFISNALGYEVRYTL
jgi:hypothetical protein